jgi:hypothetical protein
MDCKVPDLVANGTRDLTAKASLNLKCHTSGLYLDDETSPGPQENRI